MPPMPPPLPIALMAFAVVALGALAPPATGATGFGSGVGAPVLGQPLDQTVQVRVDPSDPIDARCVSAELAIGERRVPAGLVRTIVETQGPEQARIRVLSSQIVDEPVVTMTVSAGCVSRVSRRYVLLVDPPALGTPAPVVAAAEAGVAAMPPVALAATAGATPAAAEAGGASRAAPSTTGTTGTAAPAGTDTARAAWGTAGANAAQRSAERSPAPRRTAQADRPPREARGARQAREARAARTPPARTARAEAPAPAPRLRLEPAESGSPVPAAAAAVATAESAAIEQAIQAVAQAASAARAAASAASAAQARIAGLEQTVEQLRGEAKTQRDLAMELRAQLVQAGSAGRWITPLLALVALLVAVALWLAWRLNTLQRQRDGDWRAAAAPVPAEAAAGADTGGDRPATSAIPFVTSEIRPPPPGGARVRGAPAWPPAAAAPADPWSGVATVSDVRPAAPPVFQPDPEPPSMRSSTLSPPPGVEPTPPRDVSIEELIDLEQQAEFFVVLGQDEAAIDLLVEHLRQTGGGSPLPYLKLLEIYRRRNDREAYERMRSRFNRRFNAYAPEWGVDLTHGRTLEDYAGVVPRLQQLWPRPLDAMAELEALLFRRSRGELFDLPAYREVLLLYALARDLLDRESADSGTVDLLLPMNDTDPFAATKAKHYLGLETDSAPLDTRPAFAVSATAPLDLDVGLANPRPSSIFGTLDDPATLPAETPPKRS
jgi:hypothetical protein